MGRARQEGVAGFGDGGKRDHEPRKADGPLKVEKRGNGILP